MKQLIYSIRQNFLRGVAKFAYWLAGLKNPIHGYNFALFTAELVWNLHPYIKRTTCRNIRNVWSNRVNEQQIYEIAKKSIQNLALTAIELFRMGHLSREKTLTLAMEVEGWEILESVLAKGNGMIGLGMHFGNWEYAGAFFGCKGITISSVARDQNDSYFTEFVNKIRQDKGITIIPRNEKYLRNCLLVLKQNGIMGLVSDQNAGKNGIFTDFFGYPASTFRGPAAYKVKYGVDIVPLYAVRLKPGQFKVVIEQPIEISAKPDNPDEEERLILYEMNKRMERIIEKYPEQWLWLHRRWKSRPAGEVLPEGIKF